MRCQICQVKLGRHSGANHKCDIPQVTHFESPPDDDLPADPEVVPAEQTRVRKRRRLAKAPLSND